MTITDTGRFTAQDPIGAAGGDPDWYGYCLDDPINGRDPEGLWTDVYYYDENKGHIAVDPGGNGDPIGKYPMTDDDILGGPGEYRSESRKPAKVVRVETTAEQERDMQEYQRRAQKSSSVHYGLGTDDCVDAADTVLKVGGVKTPGSNGITYLVNYANKLEQMK
ncbi:MAG: hypothetical protein AB7E32_16435 [Desulfovibrio sp.]